MSRGVQRTIEWLTKAGNEAAVAVLLAALDSPYRQIRDGALGAILNRRDVAAHREIVRRLDQLEKPARRMVREHGRLMNQAIRAAVLDPDGQMCRNGCRVALWFLEYDLVPTLLNALADRENPNAPTLTATLRRLIEAFQTELTEPADPARRRDPQAVRTHLIMALESSVEHFAKHRRVEIVEAFLILAGHENALFRKIAGDPYHPAFLTVLDFLAKSTREGVLRLLLSCLEDPSAPSAVLSVIGNRYDLPFLRRLLQRIGNAPSDAIARNLKRIESIPWLQNPVGILTELNEAEQTATIPFVVGSRVPRRRAFSLVQFVLLYGKTEARRLASVALAEFHGADANELAIAALSDRDPQVQANVIRQIRGRGIPGIMRELLDLADNPHPEIQKAVRESLDEFRFERFIGTFDTLEDDVRQRTGVLVRKLDPQTIPRLREELVSGLRTRRLRALEIIGTIGAMDALEREVINVTRHDDDHLVRIAAIDALADWASPDAQDAVKRATNDANQAVAAAAHRAVAEMEGARLTGAKGMRG